MMHQAQPLHDVIDLTDPDRNVLLNMTLADARQRVATGDPARVRAIEGQFAIVARSGPIVRLARSLSCPLRYFVAKRTEGPALVVADRIDTIQGWLQEQGLADQFHPTYTRMAPAHHITEIALVGCPDPNPTYQRFFAPQREVLPPDIDAIGRAYIGALSAGIHRWLDVVSPDAPIGVCFSGGIDSGAVFVVTYHAMLSRGESPSRLRAFTLSVDGGGSDVTQARDFLDAMDLGLFHEPIEVSSDVVDYKRAIRIVEDYKPLDVQAAAVTLALCTGIRERYADWTYLIDGDGGDENLKDYPIEDNPELTIRSVLNNPMLYQEGWGVDSIKHSLTYSGGLSRGCTRGYAPATRLGFRPFSPFTLADVVEVAEGIPFIELTDWDHERLYALKGEIVARGVEAVTGMIMPIFEKRRFQNGAMAQVAFANRFPESPATYRRAFEAAFA